MKRPKKKTGDKSDANKTKNKIVEEGWDSDIWGSQLRT
jgi:hypothetical protein